MRNLALLALSTTLALAACKKKEEPTKPVTGPAASSGAAAGSAATAGSGSGPAAASAAVPVVTAPPAEAGDVLGSGAIGSVDEFVAAIEPYLAAMGAGGKLSAAGIKATVGKWIGLESWDGVDGLKPVRVWLVNPKKFKPPFVVALPVVAGKTVAVKGWASEVILGHAVLAKDATTIAAMRSIVTAQLGTPAAVTGGRVVFGLGVPELLKVYEPEIEKLLGKLSKMFSSPDAPVGGDTRKFMQWLGRGALELARQISRIDAELVTTREAARLQVKLQPVAGSSLAEFLAAPRQPLPASLAKMPADVSAAVVFAYAPDALKKVLDKVSAHMESMGADKPTSFIAFAREAFGGIFDSMKGDFVYAKRTTGSSMALLGTKDAAKSAEAFRVFYAKAGSVMSTDTGPNAIISKSELKKDAGKYKGVKFDRVRATYDYSKMPEFQRGIMEKLQGKSQDSFIATTPEYTVLAGSSKPSDKPIQDAIEQLQKGGPSLADKPEFKELLSQLPASRFGVFYFSFVEYLKGALGGLAGDGMVGALGGVKSEGFLGAGLSSEGGALQIDAVATRSQIESIRKLFNAMKPPAGMTK